MVAYPLQRHPWSTQKCEVCEKFDKSNTSSKPLLPICNQLLFKVWVLDIVGSMSGKSNNKKYIITAIDFAIWWPVVKAVKAHTGNNIWRLIGREIIRKFGKPELLITDKGKELTSNDTKVYLRKQRVKFIATTPYHPQANSRLENLNNILVQAIAKITAGTPEDWPKQLPTALLVCCTWVNSSTGKSSFELVYGTHPNIVQALTGPPSQGPIPSLYGPPTGSLFQPPKGETNVCPILQ